MTEDQAKTKWCPMTAAFAASPQHAAQAGAFLCIASDCMMWRKMIKSYGGLSEVMDDEGHCGLASKP